ncbi:hypothetical protein [Sulfuriferula thiophila]|uniref:hypothetical protein n=1 Tax=Sulfuriferula thiophila TaxID=1781211 RepID=UPI000F61186D|nr:hypothetical protein [Sulfuriferula thiophila]
MSDHPDFLRSPEDVCKPDSRIPATSFLTNQPITVKDQHDAIAEIVLHKGVPDDIRIQFETAKNLYLYAWFVYRFYPVAKLHAYTCLELALRERFELEVIASRKKKLKSKPGLSALLSYAVENSHLKNENFKVWQHRTEMNAQQRTRIEAIEQMRRLNLTEIVIDNAKYEIKDEDRNHDYLATILETMPALRNHYAHGATSLDSQALDMIKLVAEIINQIYPA